MTDAILEVVQLLRDFSQDDINPTIARARLDQLQRLHPATKMELVWQREPYDGSLHYDALLRSDGDGTISVSFCPDRVQPWPLRGAQRWSDQDLLRVNNIVLSVGHAVACLESSSEQAPIAERLVDACLIQEELERAPIVLNDAELQEAVDAFRRSRGLLRAAETRRWMQQRGISHTELELMAGDQMLIRKLRSRLVGDQVETYFTAHRRDFDTARIVRVSCSDVATACRAAALLRSGPNSFAELSVCAESIEFATVDRSSQAELAEQALSAAPGSVIGPVEVAQQFVLAAVLGHAHAQLDVQTRQRIERRLFDSWLAQGRAAARIEWNWLNTARTSRLAA